MTKTSDTQKTPPNARDNDSRVLTPDLAFQLLKSLCDPLLVTDAETGIIVDCNKEAEIFFDYPRKKLLGMLHSDLYFHKVPGSILPVGFQAGLESLQESSKVRLLTSTGQVREASARFFKVKDADRLVFVGIYCEITGLSHMTEALRQTQQRYEAMFSHILSGVAVYKAIDDGDDFIFVDFNPAAEKITAMKRDQVLGKRLLDLFPNMDKSGLPDVLKRVWTTGQAEDIPPFYYKDQIREGWRKNHIYKLPSGEVVALFQDVTESMEALKALEESEERFRFILSDVDMVAVQGYDSERRVTYWNKASETLYGYKAEEAFGRKLEDLIIPDGMRDDVIAGVTDWVNGGNPIPPGELDLLRKDGTLVPVYSHHVMQIASDGRKTMYCIDVDLTEIRKTSNELREAKNLAESANQAKSEFLANMSHEIRTPLNGILGMLQLLMTTSLDKEQSECVSNAVNASRRLTTLLSDILDLSRIEAGRMHIASAPLDLRELMSQVYDLFYATARKSGVEFTCTVHDSIPPLMTGDGVRIQQVLNNLVGNAFKFTNEGSIHLEAYPLPSVDSDKQKILFSVSDTGIGISDDKLNYLFTPFTQANAGYTRTQQGAGLGLSITKELIRLMGGTLAVESEAGNGTDIYFCLTFPVSEVDSPGARQEIPGAMTLNGLEGLRILLVEDERINLIAATSLLRKAGASVIGAENGEKALEMLREHSVDLILMDIQMPVMNGIEASKAIRSGKAGQKNISIPIIALTAYAMTNDRETFMAAGMDSYVSKPVDIQALKEAIQKVVNNYNHL